MQICCILYYERVNTYLFVYMQIGNTQYYGQHLSVTDICRQERLERLAERLGRKASLRQTWLRDMIQVLSELEKLQDMRAVDAALKRHEAISAEVYAGVSAFGSHKLEI